PIWPLSWSSDVCSSDLGLAGEPLRGPVEELARELAATLPGELDKLYFLSSGSEAVEAALKLARQYWIEAGKPGKHRIIALNPSYHGNTLLALSASAREQYKLPFREWLVDVEHIPAPYPYRR